MSQLARPLKRSHCFLPPDFNFMSSSPSIEFHAVLQTNPDSISPSNVNTDASANQPSPVVNFIKPGSVPNKEPARDVSYFELFRYALPFDLFFLAVGGVAAALQGCALPFFSLVFGDLLNSFNKTQDQMLDAVRQDALYFIYIAIASFFASWAAVTFYMIVGDRQAKRIREEYVKAILRQNLAWFNAHQAGELTSRLSADTETIADGIGQKLSSYIQFNCTFIAGVTVGLVRGWQLALVILGTAPLLIVSGAVMADALTRFAKRNADSYAKASEVADEVLTSVKTVQAMNAQILEKKRYSVLLQEAMEFGIYGSFAQSASMGFVMLTVFSSYGLALWFGAILISDGFINSYTGNPYTGGDVVTVFFSTLLGAFSLGQAAPSIPAFNSAKAAASSIFETIERTPEICLDADGERIGTVQEIVFEDVTFHYPSRPEISVLNKLNLKIPIGKKVALVGHSGCGKSTVINMIERFYDPQEGRILINGVDLKTLHLRTWRDKLALVQQEPILFSVSLKENVKFGNANATDENINAALIAANAMEFVEKLPLKLDTLCGESGNEQLSGGQKQRICIGRAIVKDPEILLLDEATAALDNDSERKVEAALDKVMPGRTSIVIAHRLSTIRNADLIYVFSNGSVVESGNHDQLLAQNGHYAALIQAEQKKSSKEKVQNEANSTDEANEVCVDGNVLTDVPLSPVARNDVNVKIESGKDERELNEVEVPISRIYSLSAEYWPIIVLALFCAIGNGAVFPLFSQILSRMLAIYYLTDLNEMKRQASLLAWAFFGLGSGMLLVNVGQGGGFGFISEKMTKLLRELSFAAMLRQESGWFDYESNQPRVLCAKLAADASAVRGVGSQQLGFTFQVLTMLIAGTVLAFYYGWRLAFVVFGIGPFMALAGWLQFKFIAGFASDFKNALAKASQLASESFAGIRTVSSFGVQNVIAERYSAILELPMELSRHKSNIAGIAFGFSNAIIFIIYAISFYFGAWLVNNNFMTFGDVLNVFFAITMASMGIGQTASFAPDTVKANEAVKTIFALLDRVPLIDNDSTSGSDASLNNSDISFEHVAFSYPNRKDVIVYKDLSLTIRAGSRVAVVGPSGSGKSTLVSLLLRFYDPSSGVIKIGGRDISQCNIASLRSQIGLVSQEPVLFNRSILENIRISRPDATDQECYDAAIIANAHDFISEFPDGYQTMVGARASQISGGQKQRIAIARAVLKNPSILLLDEATSALDNKAEELVQATLDKLMIGKTTLIVAHRLSTVKNCDVIYVMKDGQIVEKGTYQELLAFGGLFASLAMRHVDSNT